MREPSAALRQTALAAYAGGTAAGVGPFGAAGPAEYVRVVLPGLGAATALVAKAVPGAAELVFVETPPAPARTLHRRRARLQSVSPAPPAELDATLLAVPDGRGVLRADAVRALLEDPPETVEAEAVGDRRSAFRVPVSRTVSIHQPGEISGVVARTEDVSAVGIAVAGAVDLARGDLVRLRVLLDGARPLDAIGEVRRARASGRHGLQLVRMRPQDRLWLERWLAAHHG